MRSSALFLALATAGSLTLGAVNAFGHAHLTSPMRRANCQSGDDATCKTDGPCGGTPNPSFTPTIYYVGDTVSIDWAEPIDHVSTYRVAISTSGEATNAAFDGWVVVPYGMVPDESGSGNTYSYSWVVPDTENCQPCVMQLIQNMIGAQDPFYFNCADIQILQAGGTPVPTPTPGPTPTPSNPGDPIEIDGYGGCSIAALGSISPGVLPPLGLLLLVGLWFRRRGQ